jgi:TRAP-type C4-dicarboxylate transport system permease small subunit
MKSVYRLHDALTRAGYYIACLFLGLIVAIMNFEIVMRYALNSPTRWSSDLTTYLMLGLIALAVPEVTRSNRNIAITILSEKMGPAGRRITEQIRYLICVLTILCLAYLVVTTAAQEFQRGIRTEAIFQIPKWVLNATLAFGFVNAGLHFLRLIFDDPHGSTT